MLSFLRVLFMQVLPKLFGKGDKELRLRKLPAASFVLAVAAAQSLRRSPSRVPTRTSAMRGELWLDASCPTPFCRGDPDSNDLL
jgi:hypothetical protein